MSIQDKDYFIYDPSTRQKIKVSEQVYHTYYRPIWATFKRAHSHGTCSAPGCKWWLCPGECAGCRFHYKDEYSSIELLAENGQQISDDCSSIDPESAVINMLYLQGLLKRLDELMPEARIIGQLRQQGFSDSDIADRIGIKRTTFLSRLKKAESQLKEEFPDFDW